MVVLHVYSSLYLVYETIVESRHLHGGWVFLPWLTLFGNSLTGGSSGLSLRFLNPVDWQSGVTIAHTYASLSKNEMINCSSFTTFKLHSPRWKQLSLISIPLLNIYETCSAFFTLEVPSYKLLLTTWNKTGQSWDV